MILMYAVEFVGLLCWTLDVVVWCVVKEKRVADTKTFMDVGGTDLGGQGWETRTALASCICKRTEMRTNGKGR